MMLKADRLGDFSSQKYSELYHNSTYIWLYMKQPMCLLCMDVQRSAAFYDENLDIRLLGI